MKIRTTSGRRSRVVVSQLWLLGAQAVGLLGWVVGAVPSEWAPVVHGVLGTVQAVSAIMLRQSTSEPMR
jgi:hypothetical protein